MNAILENNSRFIEVDLFSTPTGEGKGLNNEVKKALCQFAIALFATRSKSFNNGAAGFDPLVGDTACQIRAIRLAIDLRDPTLFEQEIPLAETNCQTSLKYLKELDKELALVKKGDPSLKKNQATRSMRRELPLKSEELEETKQKRSRLQATTQQCRISERVYHLVLCALLSQGKVQWLNKEGRQGESLNIERFQNAIEGISKVGAKELVKVAKKQLARMSCDYMVEQARTLSQIAPGKVIDPQLLASYEKTTVVTPQLALLPCTPVMETISLLLSERQVRTMLKVRSKESGINGPQTFTSEIELAPGRTSESYETCFVIEAISAGPPLTPRELTQAIEKIGGVAEFLRLSSLQHEQYPCQKGMKTEQFFDYVACESTRAKMIAGANKAIETGLGLNDPQLCCIDHIFCSISSSKSGEV